MLLFPGEAALYEALPRGFKITADESVMPQGQLLSCAGVCPREARPLACRLFPLYIAADGPESAPRLAMDPRAWPVCPLMPSGMAGLSADFVKAAEKAAALLWTLPEVRAFLAAQSAFIRRICRPVWEENEVAE